jgi:hypothetical protein
MERTLRDWASWLGKRSRTDLGPRAGDRGPASDLPPELRLQLVEWIQSDPSAPISSLSEVWRFSYRDWARRRLSALEFPPPRGKTLALARLAFAPEWKLLTSLPAAEGFERATRAFEVGSIFLCQRFRGEWAPAFMERAPAGAGKLRADVRFAFESPLLWNLKLKARRAERGEFRPIWDNPPASDPVRSLLLYSRGRIAFGDRVGHTMADACPSLIAPGLLWGRRGTSAPATPTPEMLALRDKFVLVRAKIAGPDRARPLIRVVCTSALRVSHVGFDELAANMISWNSTVREAAVYGLGGEHERHLLDSVYLDFGFGKTLLLDAYPRPLFSANPDVTLWSLWLSTFRSGVEPAIADLRDNPAWGYDLDSNLTEAIEGRSRKGLLILPAPVYCRFRDWGFSGTKFLTRWGEVEIDGHSMMVVALPGTDPKAFAPHDIVWLDDAAGPEEMARLTLRLKRASVLEL